MLKYSNLLREETAYIEAYNSANIVREIGSIRSINIEIEFREGKSQRKVGQLSEARG